MGVIYMERNYDRSAMDQNARDTANAASEPPDDQPLGEDALRGFFAQGREFKEYALHYAAAMLDAKRAAARDIAIYAVLGAIAGVVALTMLVTSAFFILNGTALGLALLFGGRLWLAQIVTGGALLAITGGGIYAWLLMMRKAQAKRAALKFEERRQRQREKFGHDVYSHPRSNG